MEKKIIDGEYVYADGFEDKYINGAVGGITNRGEVVIEFFFEGRKKQENFQIEIDENGLVIPKENLGRNTIRREVKSGVIMRLQDAENIHRWLGEIIKQAKGTRKDSDTDTFKC